jgi:hypothetical protein
MFYLIMIWPISLFSKNKCLDQSHKLSFIFILKNFQVWKFPQLSFLFLSLLFFFSLFLPHIQHTSHAQHQPVALHRASSTHKQLASTAAGCPSPPSASTPIASPGPFLLSSPLPSSPTSPFHGSFNQARFTSCDDQNGCTQLSFCYHQPQFYPNQL